MTVTQVLELGHTLAAFWFDILTPQMEGATGRWIGGTGHFSLKDNPLPVFLRHMDQVQG